MDKRTEEKLRANQYFLVKEMERRGIVVSPIDIENELLEAVYGSHRELLLNLDSSAMSYPASVITGNKWIANKILKKSGISVPRACAVLAEERDRAVAGAREIGFPVVIKPTFGVQGEEVHTNVEYEAEARAILDGIVERHGNIPLIIEEQFEGEEYRVLITKNGDCAVVHRDPAAVTGDGRSSIKTLIESENWTRTHPQKNCLCPIVVDEVLRQFLRKSGRNLDSVPACGEKVYLRRNSNVKSGGMCEDVTELVHPSVLAIARRTLQAFPKMPYAGLDFMTKDIQRPQGNEDYRLIEINSLPGIGIHIAPGKGKPRNVAGWIVDLIFPETRAA